jgi:hypothetical protein
MEKLGGQIELPLGDVPCVDRGRDLLGRHVLETSSGGETLERSIDWLDLLPGSSRQRRGGLPICPGSGAAGSY